MQLSCGPWLKRPVLMSVSILCGEAPQFGGRKMVLTWKCWQGPRKLKLEAKNTFLVPKTPVEICICHMFWSSARVQSRCAGSWMCFSAQTGVRRTWLCHQNLNNVYIPLSESADSQQNVTAAPERQSEWACVGQIYRPASFRDSASHNDISSLLLSVRSAKARSVSPPHAEEALQQNV